MSNTLQYKGYIGELEFSEEDEVFYGKVLGIRSLISYEGATVKELVTDFKSNVDEYLHACESQNIEPEKAFKGSFNVRVSPQLHQAAVICAAQNRISLNRFVEDAIKAAVHD